MKTNHTPGPWTVQRGCANQPHEPLQVKKYWPMPGAYQVIADIPDLSAPGYDGESQANARLIAAAPELLAELEQALAIARAFARMIPAEKRGEDWPVIEAGARAAIAKAKGE